MNKLKKKPLISVIINCRNGANYLKICIKSVLKQTYKNWEIIFFDNNSSDDSLKVINGFRDSRIKIFLNKKKNFLNLYDARNIAIKKSKGEYITFIDVDDIWKKNKLLEQVKELNKNFSYQIIYANFHILNNKKKRYYLKSTKSLPSGFITQKLLNNYSVGILTLLIKREIFKKYKFNTKYNIIGDFDLVIRLSKKYFIKSVNKSLAIYRQHSNNYSSINLKIYIDELSYWLKKNKQIKYNLILLRYYLFKLKIKNLFKIF